MACTEDEAAELIVTVKGSSTTANSPIRTSSCQDVRLHSPHVEFTVREASQRDGTGYSSGMSLYLAGV